jgi:hypothetical protein
MTQIGRSPVGHCHFLCVGTFEFRRRLNYRRLYRLKVGGASVARKRLVARKATVSSHTKKNNQAARSGTTNNFPPTKAQLNIITHFFFLFSFL